MRLLKFVKFRNMSALGTPNSLLRMHPCISTTCFNVYFFYLDDSFLSKEETISNQAVSQVTFEKVSCSVMSDSLRPHGLYSPWNSPGQDTGVGSLSLL